MAESQNKTKPNPKDGCLVHAGILTTASGAPKLTSGYPNAAKEKFIRDVIDEIKSAATGEKTKDFPVGEPIPKIEFYEIYNELVDENKFPAFYQLMLTQYENIAISLNAPSNFGLAQKGLPVVDPAAVISKMGGSVKIASMEEFAAYATPNLPRLASAAAQAGIKDPILPGDVPITPVGMIKKLMDTVKNLPPPIPPVPPIPYAPNNDPPEFKPSNKNNDSNTVGNAGESGQNTSSSPPIQSKVSGAQLAPEQVAGSCGAAGPSMFKFQQAFATNIGAFIPKLLVSVPVIALQLVSKGPTAVTSSIASLVESSGLVGEPSNAPNGSPQDILMRAVRKVMCRKIAEMCLINAIATQMGSSVNGLVGIIAGTSVTSDTAGDNKPKIAGTEIDPKKANEANQPLFTDSQLNSGILPEGQQRNHMPAPNLASNFYSWENDKYENYTGVQPIEQSAEFDKGKWTQDGFGVPAGGDRYDPDHEIEHYRNSLPDDLKANFDEVRQKFYDDVINDNIKDDPEVTKQLADNENAIVSSLTIVNVNGKDIVLPPGTDENTADIELISKQSDYFRDLQETDAEEILIDEDGDPLPPNPLHTRGFDLPEPEPVAEVEVQPIPIPPGAVGGSGASAVAAKAISCAGMMWSKHKEAYSQLLFYTEYAVNPEAAKAKARVVSSCGLFARSCLQAAGASYYFGPGYKEIKPAPFSQNQTKTPSGGHPEVVAKTGRSSACVDYFNSNYIDVSIMSALERIAHYRGAKYSLTGAMPKLKAGDILIIGEASHVIVVVEDLKSDNILWTVEGGQQDPGNNFKASYKPQGGILASCIKWCKWSPGTGSPNFMQPGTSKATAVTKFWTPSAKKFGEKSLLTAINTAKLLGTEKE